MSQPRKTRFVSRPRTALDRGWQLEITSAINALLNVRGANGVTAAISDSNFLISGAGSSAVARSGRYRGPGWILDGVGQPFPPLTFQPNDFVFYHTDAAGPDFVGCSWLFAWAGPDPTSNSSGPVSDIRAGFGPYVNPIDGFWYVISLSQIMSAGATFPLTFTVARDKLLAAYPDQL